MVTLGRIPTDKASVVVLHDHAIGYNRFWMMFLVVFLAKLHKAASHLRYRGCNYCVSHRVPLAPSTASGCSIRLPSPRPTQQEAYARLSPSSGRWQARCVLYQGSEINGNNRELRGYR